MQSILDHGGGCGISEEGRRGHTVFCMFYSVNYSNPVWLRPPPSSPFLCCVCLWGNWWCLGGLALCKQPCPSDRCSVNPVLLMAGCPWKRQRFHSWKNLSLSDMKIDIAQELHYVCFIICFLLMSFPTPRSLRVQIMFQLLTKVSAQSWRWVFLQVFNLRNSVPIQHFSRYRRDTSSIEARLLLCKCPLT